MSELFDSYIFLPWENKITLRDGRDFAFKISDIR